MFFLCNTKIFFDILSETHGERKREREHSKIREYKHVFI